MSSKKLSERVHARRRAMQRYGITFGRERRSALVRAIQTDKAVFLRAFSNRSKAFAVFYEENWYAVVYDNQRKEIITFLPPEFLERYRSRLKTS